MKYIILIITVIFSSACSSSTDNSEYIVDKLKQEGKPYFRNLVETQQYESLLDRIENGDVVLIKNSYLLARWSDASTSLSLNYALSRAIIKRPDAVMSLIPKYFTIPDICTVPYVESPLKVEISHIDKSIAALSNSTKNTTNSVYTRCISVYKKIKRNITKSSSGR